ncbi:hypothetical protein [Thermomonas sp. LB-4]|uniref:hypothetical protein n=1 Tax=Thermomonas sp. LB-4 TaxID=3102790 RepID=UPI002EDB5333
MNMGDGPTGDGREHSDAHRGGKGRGDEGRVARDENGLARHDLRRALRQHGLQWESAIPGLRNAADDRTGNVFDPAIRGSTDRFVHLHRKPWGARCTLAGGSRDPAARCWRRRTVARSPRHGASCRNRGHGHRIC